MNKTILFFALITTFCIGYLLGCRRNNDRPIDTQTEEYIERYLVDHNK